ncbi:MAG: putative hydro-lyase [Stappiaceae bacterium]
MIDETKSDYELLQGAPLGTLRTAIRSGNYQGHTAGLARGQLQCNLAILPQEFAGDFLTYCQNNPKPCPLAGVSKPGEPVIETLGADLDLRTDVPLYNVYREGTLIEQVPDLLAFWRDDLVAFAIGCSFTFERALMDNGIAMRHIDLDVTVPMFRTSIQTTPCGPFGGGMVVSMRPIHRSDIDRTIALSGKYPLAHGAPVQIGAPSEIGVEDLFSPDWGAAVPIGEDEIPVFWACGVTPQSAVMRAGLSVCITHTPGAMLITDIDEFANTAEFTQPNHSIQ